MVFVDSGRTKSAGAWIRHLFLSECSDVTQKRERPKAIVHHDPGGVFLSHAWVGHLLLQEGQRRSYSLRGPKENPIVESLNALLAERIRTYHEHRLHSSLRYKTPQETLKEALRTSKVCIT
ncbi:MAG: hypothetical protein IMX04_08320 [Candidatus Carbobacillus altaicus]|nr:hypothetical protein [Candidatus Carbobacillus altaicus]